jgi:septal ring factor EnvC (AmiA/AmiB activator)
MWCVGGLMVALCAGRLQAQEAPKYDELKSMYEQSLKSLKEQQDSKSKLAADKEELAKQVASLQKQLDAVTKDRDELARQVSTFAEKTYNLRSYHATWQAFLKRYPALDAKWKVFLESDLLKDGNEAPELIAPEWPFRIEG